MKKSLTSLLFFCIFIFIVVISLRHPSNDRDWVADLERLPEVTITKNNSNIIVAIENVRDGSYANGVQNISYYPEKYDLSKIKKMWFLVEPFSKWKAAAHTFFIFDFEDGKTVAFSVEARKEKDEKYSAFRGLFREYEISYLYGSERDLILRRTSFLDHDVYMYPIKTTKENLEKLFLSITKEADSLETKPEFYNTITSSCTTTLVKHINGTSPGKIKWWEKEQYLPGLSDKLAYNLGLIDTTLPFKEVRARYNIHSLANTCATSNVFSHCIRESLEKID